MYNKNWILGVVFWGAPYWTERWVFRVGPLQVWYHFPTDSESEYKSTITPATTSGDHGLETLLIYK